jgi:phosphoribosylglycinamide formyltransferase
MPPVAALGDWSSGKVFCELHSPPTMADGTGQSRRARIAVLISGSGSNLQALINACQTAALPDANIVRVISDRKDAYGLKRAEQANIPNTYHGILPFKKKYPDNSDNPQFQEARHAYDRELAQIVLADKPDIVVCAGFMRILTTAFLDPVKEAQVPIINLHPSKPGDLVGANCIKRAWDEYERSERKQTGIMIHYVIEEVDMGQPIVHKTVDIEGCATLQDLEARIHHEEHSLIVDGCKAAIESLQSQVAH